MLPTATAYILRLAPTALAQDDNLEIVEKEKPHRIDAAFLF
jgi:hypothetical protein